jgi:hypothetical protein
VTFSFRPLPLGLALACGSFAAGCRTPDAPGSSVKELPSAVEMSAEEWVQACERELADPVEGEAAKRDLLALANTSDCTEAYPTVRAVLQEMQALAVRLKADK